MNRKKPVDPRGGHIRLYWAIVDSMAWRALSWADQGIYVAMRRKLKGTNNGNIEATLGELRHHGVTSSATLAKSLRALTTVGLIARTRDGELSQGRTVCSLYRFTDESVLEFVKLGIKAQSATNDWQKFTTLGEARAAIKAAHAAALTGKRRGYAVPRKNARPIQQVNRADSVNEVMAEIAGSIPEHGGVGPVQFLNAVRHA